MPSRHRQNSIAPLFSRSPTTSILIYSSHPHTTCGRPHSLPAPTRHLVPWWILDPSYPLAHIHTWDVAKRRNGRNSRRGEIGVGKRNFVQFYIPAGTVKFNHLQHDIVNPFTRVLGHLLHLLYCFLFIFFRCVTLFYYACCSQ
jgi:hypothetical protein